MAGGEFVIENMEVPVKSVSILGYDKEIDWHQDRGDLSIMAPVINIPEVPCKHAWVFQIKCED